MSAGIKNHRGHSHGHSHENACENARGDSHEWGRCLTVRSYLELLQRPKRATAIVIRLQKKVLRTRGDKPRSPAEKIE